MHRVDAHAAFQLQQLAIPEGSLGINTSEGDRVEGSCIFERLGRGQPPLVWSDKSLLLNVAFDGLHGLE